MDNPLLGIARFSHGNRVFTLQYTWAEISELESAFPGFAGALGDLSTLADVAAIGFRTHHPELGSGAAVKAMSPAVFVLHGAVARALRGAYHGDQEPEETVAAITGGKKKRSPLRRLWRWLFDTISRPRNSGA